MIAKLMAYKSKKITQTWSPKALQTTLAVSQEHTQAFKTSSTRSPTT
jgi:hypothetical protein